MRDDIEFYIFQLLLVSPFLHAEITNVFRLSTLEFFSVCFPSLSNNDSCYEFIKIERKIYDIFLDNLWPFGVWKSNIEQAKDGG